ncbi:MAG: tRNA (N(6)-L-threonylcarbamoyladenosine(37)-C(2))-methylthiotransferase MtaB [Methylovirgula sp.]|jgi:threonylcarbamoyladenosine tRNA methylthiotransferase MtaB
MRPNAAIKSAVEVVNFGCRVNLVEGEALRQLALTQGCDNLVIVNSCTVTAEAARQVRQTIRRLKREAPERRIFVTGCGVQIDPSSFAAMPEVDRIIGTFEKTQPESFAKNHASRVAVSDVFARKEADLPSVAGIEEHTRAFLAIQTGCDHRCSFCIIPFGRGASRSMPLAQLRDAVSACLDKGVAEIVLTGVDLTAYGKDLPGAPSLAKALREVLQTAPDLSRLRLSSIDCIETDADFLDLMASEPRLMPHLHLSLQSGDDLILKRMKRRHSREDAVEFCASLRAARPNIVFGADLIAGFPTETEAMFENTLALVEDCGLTHLHVFPFSPRPGTPAARMPQLAPSLIKERAARLREAGAKALRRHLDSQIGKQLTLLTERGGIARAEDFTKVRNEGTDAGRIIETTIVGHDGEMLRSA